MNYDIPPPTTEWIRRQFSTLSEESKKALKLYLINLMEAEKMSITEFEPDKITIKPCPFCGGRNIHFVSELEVRGEPLGAYMCADCYGSAGDDENNFDEALKAWNRRHNDTE